MKRMKISNCGLDIIKEAESLALTAYLCPAKVWTIGYGHTKGVKQGDKITYSKAEDLLREDVASAEKVLNGMNINFTQHQFDALCSFIFNIGAATFKGSTMYRLILQDADDKQIAAQFARWNKAGGKVLNGLTKRRAQEAKLFLS